MKFKLPLLCLAFSSQICSAGTFSGFAKIASNYMWRGLTFSENSPMIAASANYTLESGFYGNLFGTNLKFAEPTLYEGHSTREIDLTAGYVKTFGNWGINVFYNRFEFIDQPKISANEYSVYLSYNRTTLEYDYQPDWFGYKTSSNYVRLSHVHSLNEKYNLVGGIGYNHQSRTKRVEDSHGDWKGAGFSSYMDYYLGLQILEANGFIYEFLYTDTNRETISYASANPTDDGKRADAKDQAFTVSLTKSF